MSGRGFAKFSRPRRSTPLRHWIGIFAGVLAFALAYALMPNLDRCLINGALSLPVEGACAGGGLISGSVLFAALIGVIIWAIALRALPPKPIQS